MARQRVLIPRSLMALFCTVLQVCFGTVYAWSFFQTLLVRQLGWSFTETAWAFQPDDPFAGHLGGLGGRAAAEGRAAALGRDRQRHVLGRLYASESGAEVGHARAVLRGVRRHRRSGHRAGLRHARGDSGQVVPRQEGLGDRNRRDGIRGGCLSVEQGFGTSARIPSSRRPDRCFLRARGNLRLCPNPL